ncbi:hypothetical protein RRG08_063244 [Elysia crispata]|uniref:Uncharacterized protein n=1 Tax=Elysia crispata TaxID=231223 RepID=A0AAE1CVE7_9GAST|nr:hypothetical protein RRG08_063244 [Elysia crispata]
MVELAVIEIEVSRGHSAAILTGNSILYGYIGRSVDHIFTHDLPVNARRNCGSVFLHRQSNQAIRSEESERNPSPNVQNPCCQWRDANPPQDCDRGLRPSNLHQSPATWKSGARIKLGQTRQQAQAMNANSVLFLPSLHRY